jgi:hypothetical protein
MSLFPYPPIPITGNDFGSVCSLRRAGFELAMFVVGGRRLYHSAIREELVLNAVEVVYTTAVLEKVFIPF